MDYAGRTRHPMIELRRMICNPSADRFPLYRSPMPLHPPGGHVAFVLFSAHEEVRGWGAGWAMPSSLNSALP